MNLRVTAATWAKVWGFLERSFTHHLALEWGAIGLVGATRNAKRPALLVAKVLQPAEGDFRRQGRLGLTFDRSYIRRAILEARALNLQGLITFHTHPGSDQEVDFSQFDDREDLLLMENLHELMPGAVHASVVAGRRSLKGRAWFADGAGLSLDDLVIVGDHLVVRPLTGTASPPPPPPTALFDRARAVTGDGALARLSRMQVGVVGASGTGSIMAELLVRAGVGHLALIDPDIVKIENLNRILHATHDDARLARFKVDVLKCALDRLGFQTQIEAWNEDITLPATARKLARFDALIGCVDRNWPRLLMNQVARQYLLPFIDVGTEIAASERGIEACTARASYVRPEGPCLVCSGVIDVKELGAESLADEQRDRIAPVQYGTKLVQPAVMDLNARASSYGALLFRHLLQPMLREPLPVHVLESILTFGMNQSTSATSDPSCTVCGTGAGVALGDDCALSTRPSND